MQESALEKPLLRTSRWNIVSLAKREVIFSLGAALFESDKTVEDCFVCVLRQMWGDAALPCVCFASDVG